MGTFKQNCSGALIVIMAFAFAVLVSSDHDRDAHQTLLAEFFKNAIIIVGLLKLCRDVNFDLRCCAKHDARFDPFVHTLGSDGENLILGLECQPVAATMVQMCVLMPLRIYSLAIQMPGDLDVDLNAMDHSGKSEGAYWDDNMPRVFAVLYSLTWCHPRLTKVCMAQWLSFCVFNYVVEHDYTFEFCVILAISMAVCDNLSMAALVFGGYLCCWGLSGLGDFSKLPALATQPTLLFLSWAWPSVFWFPLLRAHFYMLNTFLACMFAVLALKWFGLAHFIDTIEIANDNWDRSIKFVDEQWNLGNLDQLSLLGMAKIIWHGTCRMASVASAAYCAFDAEGRMLGEFIELAGKAADCFVGVNVALATLASTALIPAPYMLGFILLRAGSKTLLAHFPEAMCLIPLSVPAFVLIAYITNAIEKLNDLEDLEESDDQDVNALVDSVVPVAPAKPPNPPPRSIAHCASSALQYLRFFPGRIADALSRFDVWTLPNALWCLIKVLWRLLWRLIMVFFNPRLPLKWVARRCKPCSELLMWVAKKMDLERWLHRHLLHGLAIHACAFAFLVFCATSLSKASLANDTFMRGVLDERKRQGLPLWSPHAALPEGKAGLKQIVTLFGVNLATTGNSTSIIKPIRAPVSSIVPPVFNPVAYIHMVVMYILTYQIPNMIKRASLHSQGAWAGAHRRGWRATRERAHKRRVAREENAKHATKLAFMALGAKVLMVAEGALYFLAWVVAFGRWHDATEACVETLTQEEVRHYTTRHIKDIVQGIVKDGKTTLLDELGTKGAFDLILGQASTFGSNLRQEREKMGSPLTVTAAARAAATHNNSKERVGKILCLYSERSRAEENTRDLEKQYSAVEEERMKLQCHTDATRVAKRVRRLTDAGN